MVRPVVVAAEDPRIDALESRIEGQPERRPYGQHILFFDRGEDAPRAWLHVIPIFWLGGQTHVMARSHWLYMARIASTRPLYLAAVFRAWYAMPEFPGLYPLTMISRPAGETARRQHMRLGFAPDEWYAVPGALTFHAATPECALFAPRAARIPRRAS